MISCKSPVRIDLDELEKQRVHRRRLEAPRHDFYDRKHSPAKRTTQQDIPHVFLNNNTITYNEAARSLAIIVRWIAIILTIAWELASIVQKRDLQICKSRSNNNYTIILINNLIKLLQRGEAEPRKPSALRKKNHWTIHTFRSSLRSFRWWCTEISSIVHDLRGTTTAIDLHYRTVGHFRCDPGDVDRRDRRARARCRSNSSKIGRDCRAPLPKTILPTASSTLPSVTLRMRWYTTLSLIIKIRDRTIGTTSLSKNTRRIAKKMKVVSLS